MGATTILEFKNLEILTIGEVMEYRNDFDAVG